MNRLLHLIVFANILLLSACTTKIKPVITKSFYELPKATQTSIDISQKNNQKIFPIKVESKYGFVDINGKIVIEPIFDEYKHVLQYNGQVPDEESVINYLGYIKESYEIKGFDDYNYYEDVYLGTYLINNLGESQKIFDGYADCIYEYNPDKYFIYRVDPSNVMEDYSSAIIGHILKGTNEYFEIDPSEKKIQKVIGDIYIVEYPDKSTKIEDSEGNVFYEYNSDSYLLESDHNKNYFTISNNKTEQFTLIDKTGKQLATSKKEIAILKDSYVIEEDEKVLFFDLLTNELINEFDFDKEYYSTSPSFYVINSDYFFINQYKYEDYGESDVLLFNSRGKRVLPFAYQDITFFDIDGELGFFCLSLDNKVEIYNSNYELLNSFMLEPNIYSNITGDIVTLRNWETDELKILDWKNSKDNELVYIDTPQKFIDVESVKVKNNLFYIYIDNYYSRNIYDYEKNKMLLNHNYLRIDYYSDDMIYVETAYYEGYINVEGQLKFVTSVFEY